MSTAQSLYLGLILVFLFFHFQLVLVTADVRRCSTWIGLSSASVRLRVDIAWSKCIQLARRRERQTNQPEFLCISGNFVVDFVRKNSQL